MKRKYFYLSIAIAFITFAFKLNAQVRIVCIGDSITEGYGLDNSSYESYPAQLGALLGTGYNVLNCGVSGTTMAKASNVSYWNTGRLTQAVNFAPQIVIINLGTNDADPFRWNVYKNEYYSDYVAMIAEFRKNGKNPIIFTCLTPPKFTASAQSEVIKNEVIPIINQVSIAQGTYIIDFYNNLLTAGAGFPDGVHPDTSGAAVMAQIAKNAIKNVNLIVPHISVNGVVKDAETVSVNASDNVILAPLPASPAAATDGTWSWTGPNGFSAASRQVTLNNISISNGGFYISTYTNPAGLKSIECFIVSVEGCSAAAIVPYIHTSSGWSQSVDIQINAGQSLGFGPQPTNGSWSWTGPNDFSLINRSFDLNKIKVKHTGNYVATYTSPGGCKSSVTFKVNVIGPDICETTPIVPYINVNNAGWLKSANATCAVGSTLNFGPQPFEGTWIWTGPNGFTKNSREFTLNNIQVNQFGTYTATNTNKCGGITTQDFIISSNTLSVHQTMDDSKDDSFYIYPNSNKGIFNIEFHRTEYHKLEIFTSTGNLIYSKELHGEKTLKIDISNIVKTGVYIVSLQSKKGTSTKKLLAK